MLELTPKRVRAFATWLGEFINVRGVTLAERDAVVAHLIAGAEAEELKAPQLVPCVECIYWLRRDDIKAQVRKDITDPGQCRRHAPPAGGWPIVEAPDACGDGRRGGSR